MSRDIDELNDLLKENRGYTVVGFNWSMLQNALNSDAAKGLVNKIPSGDQPKPNQPAAPPPPPPPAAASSSSVPTWAWVVGGVGLAAGLGLLVFSMRK